MCGFSDACSRTSRLRWVLEWVHSPPNQPLQPTGAVPAAFQRPRGRLRRLSGVFGGRRGRSMSDIESGYLDYEDGKGASAWAAPARPGDSW